MNQKLISLTVLLFCSQVLFSQWLCPWENRIPVTITEHSGSALINHQVRVDLNFTTGMKADFSDIRFTTSNGQTLIDFWIEDYTASTEAIVWVEVPNLPASTTTDIYVYYSNPTAITASNGTNTFVFFDHFDTFSGWSNIGSGLVQSDNTTFPNTSTLAKVTQCDPSGGVKLLGSTISDFRLITREIRASSGPSGCGLNRYGLEDGSYNGYNINRNADTGANGKPFGFERRTGGSSNNHVNSNMNQPWDIWYRTELKRCSANTNNITATLFKDDRTLIGSTTGTDTQYSSFDRLTVRGGRDYHIDFMAVAKYTCSSPSISLGAVEENLPTAICQDATVLLDAAGVGSISASDIDNNSTDLCGIDQYNLNISNFSCDNLGTNVVILTVEDSHENTSTCSATVTVNDEINPTVSCPTNIEIDANTANCSANVPFSGASGTDNCGIASKDLSHASGDLFPSGVTTIVLTATDFSTNSATCSFTVTVNNSLAAPSIIATDNSGNANNDSQICEGASATLTVDGFFAQYEWSNNTSNQSTDVSTAGSYSVSVTDDIGCTNSNSTTIIVNEAPEAGTCNVVHDLCQIDAGQVSIQANGGAAPYNVSWTPNVGSSTSQIISTSGGQITITDIPGGSTINISVTDSNGCSPN